MLPEKTDKGFSQGELFRSRLEQILNPSHPLINLTESIDWSVFEQSLGPLYIEEVGRPGLAIRLMVGLHYLKYLFNESDESVVARFVENPYWQYFCGNEYFEHGMPCHPTSLVKWRRRVGAEGIEQLLKETISTGKREGQITDKELSNVNADTTVQEKAIAFPTDARLYDKARTALVREAEKENIKLRQSYKRIGKRTLREQGALAAARQYKKAKKATKKLKIYLGRVIRDLERKCGNPSERLAELLEIAKRIERQQRADHHKIYSVHSPEVECIGKGKAHKKYEFGCKVGVVTTSNNNWVVGIDAFAGNPYDGATLIPAINQMEKLTAKKPGRVFVDRGYRGDNYHPANVEVYLSGRRGLDPILKKLLRNRSAIEPSIGHLKHDNRMGRNYLRGTEGDRINAMLSGCGWNLRKLLRIFFLSILARVILINFQWQKLTRFYQQFYNPEIAI